MGNVTTIFRALADPTRREILIFLRDGERPAGEIASQFDMAAPSVSRHLSILKSAELIAERREGNRILYSAEDGEITDCLNNFVSSICPTQVYGRKKRAKKNKGGKKQ